jgi:hypothetical protein
MLDRRVKGLRRVVVGTVRTQEVSDGEGHTERGRRWDCQDAAQEVSGGERQTGSRLG